MERDEAGRWSMNGDEVVGVVLLKVNEGSGKETKKRSWTRMKYRRQVVCLRLLLLLALVRYGEGGNRVEGWEEGLKRKE
jgi:hypothetical protein